MTLIVQVVAKRIDVIDPEYLGDNYVHEIDLCKPDHEILIELQKIRDDYWEWRE